MPKKLLATTIILTTILAIVVGMQVVKVVDANPFSYYHFIEPDSGTIPPNITIFGPQQNTIYYSDKVAVSFNVSKPQLGTPETRITNVNYTLDDETVQAYAIHPYETGFGTASGIPEFNTTFTSPSLLLGNHHLTVSAEGVVWAGGRDIFFIDSSSTTFFTVDTQPTIQPSLKPNISSTSSISPTPTSSQSIAFDNWLNPTFLNLLAIVIGIVAIASISLVYFKRRKGKPRREDTLCFLHYLHSQWFFYLHLFAKAIELFFPQAV